MSVTTDKSLIKIMGKLHDEKGLDFTQYKEAMLLRRINSRMKSYDITSYEQYLKIIEDHPEELDELARAFSINVTEFFRNPEMFEAVNSIVIPEILERKNELKHRIVRIWSCGCASGDEPYSLAMILLENMGKKRIGYLITVIGSDIDKDSLEEAKDTVYSRESLKAIDKEMLHKYFDETPDHEFKIKSFLKSMVRFRYHDVIKDAPFINCDMIMCRNLLIYFNKQLQEEILLKFYECLNPGGFLVLGMTETLTGSSADRFMPIDNRLRIYRRPEIEESLDTSVLPQERIDEIVKGLLGK